MHCLHLFFLQAEHVAEPSPPRVQLNPFYTCWLYKYSQKNMVTIRSEETTTLGPVYSIQWVSFPLARFVYSLTSEINLSVRVLIVSWCKFVVGDKEYPAASGKTKKEAKEEAAKLVYMEITGREALDVSETPV